MLVVSRHVDEWLQIGDDLFVGPTDIDSTGVRLIARGRMIGGPDDGATFTKTADVAKGGEMRVGPHVLITVIEVAGDAVRLGVHTPRHLPVHRKEIAEAQKKKWQEEAGE